MSRTTLEEFFQAVEKIQADDQHLLNDVSRINEGTMIIRSTYYVMEWRYMVKADVANVDDPPTLQRTLYLYVLAYISHSWGVSEEDAYEGRNP